MGVFDRLEWFVGGKEGEDRSERVVLLSIVHQFHNYLFQESCSIDWLTSAFYLLHRGDD